MPLDTEIDAMLPEIEAALNTRLDRQYLFAGSRTDARPVSLPATPITTADPTLYFRGDDAPAVDSRRHGSSSSATASRPTIPRSRELIAALGQARAAHLADDRAGLQGAMAALGGAHGWAERPARRAGGTAARLESITEGHRSAILYLDEIVSGIEDADLADVLTRIASDQASVEAAYTVTGRLASLSLADYLR